jgi:hypothetical protein
MERMPDRGEGSNDTAGSLSRREFTTRVGAGSAATFAMAFAAPKISTIRLTSRAAQVGSPTSTSTSSSTTSTTVGGQGPKGKIKLSRSAACVGDTIVVQADGFAPNTAVNLQIDSSAFVIGVVTANNKGEITVNVKLKSDYPQGPHKIRAVGIAPGGRTLTLDAPINIKTQGDCDDDVENEGTTSTVVAGQTSTSVTPTSAPVTPTSSRVSTGGGTTPSQGSGSLAFTGSDAVDLAVVGIAAAVGGRALYALARNGEDDDDE